MDKEMKEYLLEGEQVRWQGQPEKFPLLENCCRSQILRRWILTVIIVGGLLAVYLQYNAHPSMGFVGLALLVGVIVLASPLLEKGKLAGYRYCITDKRVILLTKDKTFYCMELSAIDEWKIVRGATENDCLVLGGTIFEEVKKQLRWRAGHPKVDLQAQEGQDFAAGMVLYDLNDAESAAALLKESTRYAG